MSTSPKVDEIKAPQCVGFIMDGNRRWAKEQGLATVVGHQAGEEKFYNVAQWVKEAHIQHAVFYAFSTENWLRDSVEVTYLMQLFEVFMAKMLSEVAVTKVRVRIIGERNRFSLVLQTLMDQLETASVQYSGTTIWVALSYGGRAEIVAACNLAISEGVPIDENSFTALLSTSGMPDPDLIIRTGGDVRLSNFLPWQSVYSELFFIDTYWPAFTKDEFTRIVGQYADRQCRRGK